MRATAGQNETANPPEIQDLNPKSPAFPLAHACTKPQTLNPRWHQPQTWSKKSLFHIRLGSGK